MTSSAPEVTTTQDVPPPHQAPAPSTHAPVPSTHVPVSSMPQGTVAPLQQQQQQPQGATTMSQSMSGSFEAQKDYSQSLDKLNSSLSELQGEIMKLSLSHGTTTTNSYTDAVQQHAPVPQQQQQQHHAVAAASHHPRPESSSGEPDVVSARSSVSAETTSQQHSLGTYR